MLKPPFFAQGKKDVGIKDIRFFGKRPRKNIFEREMCRRRGTIKIPLSPSISIYFLAEPLIFLPLFRTSKVLRLIGKKILIKFLETIRAKNDKKRPSSPCMILRGFPLSQICQNLITHTLSLDVFKTRLFMESRSFQPFSHKCRQGKK